MSSLAASALVPNPVFAELATADRVQRTAAALEANGFRAIVAATAAEAHQIVVDLLNELPESATVFDATSRTLDEIGLSATIAGSERLDHLRPKLYALDYMTQRDQIRRLGAAPDVILGSVHAVTEGGHLLIASASGSQLGPYASGAGHIMWVVGSQKIVRDREEGFRRIEEYSYPLEDARAREVYGRPSAVNKVLLVNGEFPGRATVVLVNERLGF